MTFIKMKTVLVIFIILHFACVSGILAQEGNDSEEVVEESTEKVLSEIKLSTNEPTLPPPVTPQTISATLTDKQEHKNDKTEKQKDHSSKSDKKDEVKEVNEEAVEDDEDDDDEDECGDDSGPILLSQFVRRFNTSQYVPADYEEKVAELEAASAEADATGGHLASILSAKFTHINHTLALMDRMQAYGEQLMAGSKDLKDTALYIGSLLSDRMTEAKLDAQCSADLANIGRGLQERKFWAAKLIDSWGHIPSGLIAGTMSSFGEFDQCISIRSGIMDEETGRRIYGKYCPVKMRIVVPRSSQYTPKFETIIKADPRIKAAMEMALTLEPEEFDLDDIQFDVRLFSDFKVAQLLSEMNEVMKGAAGIYGTCFPASCSAEDIERLFNFIIYPITGVPVQVKEEQCTMHEDAREPIKLDKFQRVAVVVFGIVGTIVGTCTIIHALLILAGNIRETNQKKENAKIEDSNGNREEVTVTNGNTISIDISGEKVTKPEVEKPIKGKSLSRQLLLSFSAITNSQALFTFNNRHAVLDTLRFGLTVVIFAVQSTGFTAGMSVQTLKSMMYSTPRGMGSGHRDWWLRVPGLWNDGFVFTFGVTLVFQQFNRLSKAGATFNYLTYFLRRWFRLSLSLVGIVMAIWLFPLAGDGPYWHMVEHQFVEGCRDSAMLRSLFGFYGNWNTYLNDYKVGAYFPICAFPTWFICMSTQLYLFAPLIFLSMFFYPSCGVTFTLIVLLVSPIFTLLPRLLTGFVTYAEATKFTSLSDGWATIMHYHMNPSLYVTSLTIGMLTGYLIKRHPNIKFPGGRFSERALWLISFLGTVGIFLWFDSFFGDYRAHTTATEAMSWWVISKFVFPGFLAVTCYLCCTGRGGTVNNLLTIQILQPIAKLSFGIYLLRSVTMYYRIGTVRYTYPLYYGQMWQNIFFDYLITAVLSYFLHILFDGPAMALIKIAETVNFDRLFKRPESENNALSKKVETSQDQVESKEIQPPLPPTSLPLATSPKKVL